MTSNEIRTPRIDKVTVHIGVGESGERLTTAERLLETITGQKPVRAKAKKTLPEFKIKKREPIGCKVTLRGGRAESFLKTALSIVDNRLSSRQFDSSGSFSFGIEEHTDFPGMKYDPNVGIFGMDVSVALKRAGYRVKRRRVERHRLPNRQQIKREEVISFISEKYGVQVS